MHESTEVSEEVTEVFVSYSQQLESMLGGGGVDGGGGGGGGSRLVFGALGSPLAGRGGASSSDRR